MSALLIVVRVSETFDPLARELYYLEKWTTCTNKGSKRVGPDTIRTLTYDTLSHFDLRLSTHLTALLAKAVVPPHEAVRRRLEASKCPDITDDLNLPSQRFRSQVYQPICLQLSE